MLFTAFLVLFFIFTFSPFFCKLYVIYIYIYNKTKQSFWINFELGQFNSISHFCLIAGVEPLDCGYRVVGSLLLLLAISEIIPGSAGTLGDCRMSQFIHYV